MKEQKDIFQGKYYKLSITSASAFTTFSLIFTFFTVLLLLGALELLSIMTQIGIFRLIKNLRDVWGPLQLGQWMSYFLTICFKVSEFIFDVFDQSDNLKMTNSMLSIL